MRMRKYLPVLAVVAAFIAPGAGFAQPQSYPSGPIRLIVPYGTGGLTDIVARVVAPGLSESLGQPVVVENRPGANGRIGLEYVANARPDGYTISVATSELAVNPVLFNRVPYDAQKDFAPISLVMLVPTVLVVHPSVRAQSVNELIAFAKANPGKLNYGSAGTGSANHLVTEVFKNAAGIDALHIPYKGGGAVMADLVGGQVQFTFATIPAAISHVNSGRLRALGLSTLKRSPALPDVPTVAETALPGFDVSTWLGIFAPKDTPTALIDLLNRAVLKSLQRADIVERLEAQGAEIIGSSPARLRSHLNAEISRWEKLAKEVKFEKTE
jgi:tripartite-type tricarboxylate transporter receptor subunit TctC